jgi:pimeloyl-ACP methyl ester carboxylesterase
MARGNPKALAIFPPPGAPVSLKSWLREMGAVARAAFLPPPFPRDAARGKGQKVIVLPGFAAHDITTARLRDFLKRQGFQAHAWTCGVNIGPVKDVLASIEKQVDVVAGEGQVALLGVSLGGTIARAIARRRPEKISRVITLGSPIRVPVVSPLAPVAQAAALLWEEEARAELAHIAEPLPMPLTALVSPIDGVVDWRGCVPDPGETVEVIEIEEAHTAMCANATVQRIIAERLARC